MHKRLYAKHLVLKPGKSHNMTLTQFQASFSFLYLEASEIDRFLSFSRGIDMENLL